jgi:hypothetical protein
LITVAIVVFMNHVVSFVDGLWLPISYAALKKRVERITGKRRKRGARVKVVDLFKDERLTGAVLDFLKDTDIGKRYE